MKKSKRLDYTLVAEGYAEYSFIPAYLQKLALGYDIQPVPGRLGLKGQKAGKAKVLQDVGKIFIAAIQQDHQLLIAGVDLDAPDHEPEQPKHTVQCKLLIEAFGKSYQTYGNRIVHFVTVQAIEQWLAYQAYQVGIANKFNPNSLEGKAQGELKKLLYGEKETGPKMDQIARIIAEKADFNELAKQSRSFNHFHKQITTFLTQYSK